MDNEEKIERTDLPDDPYGNTLLAIGVVNVLLSCVIAYKWWPSPQSATSLLTSAEKTAQAAAASAAMFTSFVMLVQSVIILVFALSLREILRRLTK